MPNNWVKELYLFEQESVGLMKDFCVHDMLKVVQKKKSVVHSLEFNIELGCFRVQNKAIFTPGP